MEVIKGLGGDEARGPDVELLQNGDDRLADASSNVLPLHMQYRDLAEPLSVHGAEEVQINADPGVLPTRVGLCHPLKELLTSRTHHLGLCPFLTDHEGQFRRVAEVVEVANVQRVGCQSVPHHGIPPVCVGHSVVLPVILMRIKRDDGEAALRQPAEDPIGQQSVVDALMCGEVQRELIGLPEGLLEIGVSLDARTPLLATFLQPKRKGQDEPNQPDPAVARGPGLRAPTRTTLGV